MVLFALKYDKEYQAEKMYQIRLFETEIEEHENQDEKEEITLDSNEKETLIKNEEIKEDEHEEITGG